MRFMPQQAGGLHFIGIGGIGMSGLAELLHTLGYAVQGSDAQASSNTKRLQDKGLTVFVGHDAGHVASAQKLAAVVVSSAIHDDNPELNWALENEVPVVHRADILAGLMRLKWSVGIAGTHGKTTTTSMVATLLEAGDLDPTVINGGIVNAYGTNVRLGHGDWLVAETDESDGTFLKLPVTASIVTNIDPEHLEHYGTAESLVEAFRQYIHQMPFYGFSAVCVDHPTVRAIADSTTDRRLITYGFAEDAQVRCHDISASGDTSTFTITAGARVLQNLELHVPGRHNVQNATGAVAIAMQLGLTDAQIRAGLAAFRGVKRRFTTVGNWNGVRIIDDYAHHPAEIAAVMETARSVLGGKGRVLVAVQPHRFTRLRDLMEDFATVLRRADALMVCDVYTAGEAPIAGVDSDALAARIGREGVARLHTADELAPWVAQNAQSGDMVLCLGAGSISAWANALPEQLAALSKQAA